MTWFTGQALQPPTVHDETQGHTWNSLWFFRFSLALEVSLFPSVVQLAEAMLPWQGSGCGRRSENSCWPHSETPELSTSFPVFPVLMSQTISTHTCSALQQMAPCHKPRCLHLGLPFPLKGFWSWHIESTVSGHDFVSQALRH